MRDDLPCQADHDGLDSEISWLLGQPHLEDYLDFVKRKAVGGSAASPDVLADEWRAANDLYHDLEQDEAGAADTIECRPLDRGLEELASALQAEPYYRASFDTLPTTIVMVELDKLIVSQTDIANSFSQERARRLGAQPTPEQLFRFCLPAKRENPPVRIQRLGSSRYLFSSLSTDLRAHDLLLLRPGQVLDAGSTGPLAGMVALPVGFGSNFLTAIRSDNRVLLHNGHHRAYTLRALGVTHAPCIVETVSRTSELRVTAGERIANDPAFYFRAARPPMLKDFFNAALVKKLLVRPMETMIEVELNVRSATSTDVTH